MTPARGRLRVFADADAFARGVANWLTARAVGKHGRVRICLAGGNTPKHIYTLLASAPLAQRFPWACTDFVFGDERFVPPDSADSNARMACQTIFAYDPARQAHMHTVPTVGLSPQAAADQYATMLHKLYGADTLSPARLLFDATLLGVGDDGHTASLLPGDPAVEERQRWVVAVDHGRPPARITLTLPVLQSSQAVAFLLQGEAKRDILNRLLSGDETLPAGRVHPAGELIWFADRAAAGNWSGNDAGK
jgi:6-phosphogluconolactonase